MDISRHHCSENGHSEAKGRGISFSSYLPRGCIAAVGLVLLCLGASAPAPVAAQELGRLFLTPQQRQDLDRRRATNRAEEEAPQIREGPLTLEGHVQRSSGKTTTWISGVPQYDSHSSRDPARVTVAPNQGEPGIDLKVGQIYERQSGEIRDNLRGGQITVGQPARRNQPAARPGAPARSRTPAPAR